MDPDYSLFATVVAEGSLSAAGRALRISPAMVSKRLARLEARLGVRLLHRTTRRLALTETGERFHADVAAILQRVRDAEARVTGARTTPRGALNVTAPTSFGRLHVAPLVADFLSAYPDVQLELNLSDDFVDLIGARVDVAVRIVSAIPPALEARRLSSNRRVLCASPAYLARHGDPRSLADLRDHHLLAAAGQLPWRLREAHRTVTVDGTSRVHTNSSELVRELVTAGLGIGFRSLWDVGDELANGTLLRVLPQVEGPPDLAVYAVQLRSPQRNTAADAFSTFLQGAFAGAAW